MNSMSTEKPLLDRLLELKSILDFYVADFSDYSEEHKEKAQRANSIWPGVFDDVNRLEQAKKELFHLKDELRNSKETNKSQEEKYEQLYELFSNKLDNVNQNLSADDLRVLRIEVSENRYSSWTTIEEQSRNMLGTALYLFKQLRLIKGKDIDFAPVIVEYCRVLENEMKRKLFLDFLGKIKSQNLLSQEKIYWILSKASTDPRPEKPDVTLMVMACSLNDLNSSTKSDQTARALAAYLRENNWNKRRITETDFTQSSVDYTDVYRNKAAHPGRIMKETEAEDCARQTEKLVEHFISCMPTN